MLLKNCSSATVHGFQLINLPEGKTYHVFVKLFQVLLRGFTLHHMVLFN